MSIRKRAAVLAAALLVPAGAACAQPITLEQAVARARAANPSEAAAEAALEAARAATLQAGFRPNPSIIVDGGVFIPPGPSGGPAQDEITATYTQLLERGGKRAARQAFARSGIGVEEATRDVMRLELAAAVQRAFLDVLVADRATEIAQKRLAIEGELQREAVRRVRAAKDPLFVETRAAARVAAARIAVDQARLRGSSARAALAAFWSGSGDQLRPQGDVLALASAVRQGGERFVEAEHRLSDAQIARAGAEQQFEETRATRDWTVGGGARLFRGVEAVGVVGSITIPLGRYDRNQGNIARARAERVRVEAEAERRRRDHARALATFQRDAEAARLRALAIEREVVPRTMKALAQVREGYARGGFSFRDIQDTADAIIAAQAEFLTALTDFSAAQADIDRLTGRFDTIPAEAQP